MSVAINALVKKVGLTSVHQMNAPIQHWGYTGGLTPTDCKAIAYLALSRALPAKTAPPETMMPIVAVNVLELFGNEIDRRRQLMLRGTFWILCILCKMATNPTNVTVDVGFVDLDLGSTSGSTIRSTSSKIFTDPCVNRMH